MSCLGIESKLFINNQQSLYPTIYLVINLYNSCRSLFSKHIMASRYHQKVTFVLALAAYVAGQKTTTVPADLQAGFSSDEVQVSFTNEAINGFKDGTIFTKNGKAVYFHIQQTMLKSTQT